MVLVASYTVFCPFFLCNCVQRVVLPEGVSFYGFVTSGVPRGAFEALCSFYFISMMWLIYSQTVHVLSYTLTTSNCI